MVQKMSHSNLKKSLVVVNSAINDENDKFFNIVINHKINSEQYKSTIEFLNSKCLNIVDMSTNGLPKYPQYHKDLFESMKLYYNVHNFIKKNNLTIKLIDFLRQKECQTVWHKLAILEPFETLKTVYINLIEYYEYKELLISIAKRFINAQIRVIVVSGKPIDELGLNCYNIEDMEDCYSLDLLFKKNLVHFKDLLFLAKEKEITIHDDDNFYFNYCYENFMRIKAKSNKAIQKQLFWKYWKRIKEDKKWLEVVFGYTLQTDKLLMPKTTRKVELYNGSKHYYKPNIYHI
jgi:hypothetical protein